MNESTISDQAITDALRAAGHTEREIARVLNERRAWMKFRAELRDDFAKAALTGLLASPRAPLDASGAERITANHISRLAFTLADTMLHVRGLRGPGDVD